MDYINIWSSDACEKRIISYNIENFLLQFNKEDSIIVKRILEKVVVINPNAFAKKARAFVKKTEEFINQHQNIGVFFAINHIEFVHHSNAFQSYFPKEKNIFTSIFFKADDVYKFSEYEEILLVDDYSGSGQSICDALTFMEQNITKQICVYVACMFMTSNAKNRINNFVKENGLKNIEVTILEDKIEFRNEFIKKDCNFDDIQIKQFEDLCLKVCDESFDEIYGYQSADDGITFIDWTPNTTISMLWKSTKKYEALFSRNRYPFGNRRFWKREDITKLKDLSIHKVYYVRASIAYLLVAGYNYDKIIKILKLSQKELENNIYFLVEDKYISYISLEETNFFIQGEDFFKLIDKEKYYKFIHGVEIKKTVKRNLISAKK